MQTYWVVKALQVFENGDSGLLLSGEVGTIHAFTLECVEEGLHGRVIVAIGCGAHAHLNALGRKQCLVALTAVFAASVRMVKQTRLRMSASQRHVQRERDQVLIFVWGRGI
nr:hypothetical protein [Ktedonobacter racemifer]